MKSSNVFLDRVLKVEKVGSRVTCDPAPMDTDEDILILTNQIYGLLSDCKDDGFDVGEIYLSDDTPGSMFYCLRKEYINLIVTESEIFFDKFMLATHVCKTLNVLKKENRIVVFQAILYGKP